MYSFTLSYWDGDKPTLVLIIFILKVVLNSKKLKKWWNQSDSELYFPAKLFTVQLHNAGHNTMTNLFTQSELCTCRKHV